VGRLSDDLFDAIGSVSVEKIGTFNSQGLSNLAWAFSLKGRHSNAVFDKVAERSVQKMQEFKPQEKTMLLLAYSRLDHSYPELFDKVANLSLPHLERFALIDLFNLAISYAKVGHIHKPWMIQIADEVVRRSSDEYPHMHTGMLWAYATARISHPKLVEFLTDSLRRDSSRLDGEHTASTVWSLASLGCRNKQLFDALAEASDEESLKKFSAQALSNMAWAYATAGEARPLLFQGIAKEAVSRNDFSSQGISNLLWAFASASYFDDRLFSSMAVRAKESLDSFNSQALANVAWAYTVANVDAECLFGDDTYVNKIIEKWEEFDNAEALTQLYKWHLWQTKEKSNIGLPSSFQAKCSQSFLTTNTKSSTLQNDVSSELALLGLNPVEEYETQSGYKLDALVEINGRKVGIEVDGPTHFIDQQPTGRTLLKRRQVASIDKIPIASVPYWEWNKLGNGDSKRKYLQSLLESTNAGQMHD
jgi:hypothetical protein